MSKNCKNGLHVFIENMKILLQSCIDTYLRTIRRQRTEIFVVYTDKIWVHTKTHTAHPGVMVKSGMGRNCELFMREGEGIC